MRNALLREIRSGLDAPQARPAPQPRVPWLAYLAAAACLAVAFLSTFQLNDARAQHAKDAQLLVALQARLDKQQVAQSVVADLLAPGTQRFSVPRGLVARGNGRVIIALQHLPALPKGKVYQAWTLRRGAKSVEPSITFTPDASGLLIVELPGSAADLAAVAMSVEPAGGSKAPTTTPAFVRPLS
jgi:anti-sigma-K factor RskA